MAIWIITNMIKIGSKLNATWSCSSWSGLCTDTNGSEHTSQMKTLLNKWPPVHTTFSNQNNSPTIVKQQLWTLKIHKVHGIQPTQLIQVFPLLPTVARWDRWKLKHPQFGQNPELALSTQSHIFIFQPLQRGQAMVKLQYWSYSTDRTTDSYTCYKYAHMDGPFFSSFTVAAVAPVLLWGPVGLQTLHWSRSFMAWVGAELKQWLWVTVSISLRLSGSTSDKQKPFTGGCCSGQWTNRGYYGI